MDLVVALESQNIIKKHRTIILTMLELKDKT